MWLAAYSPETESVAGPDHSIRSNAENMLARPESVGMKYQLENPVPGFILPLLSW